MIGFLDILCYIVIGILLVQVVRLAVADADLTLLWYMKFGRKPDVLLGDVVWVTGASSGIGEYLSYELAKASCRLVLSARRKDELERVKQQCIARGRIREDDILVLPLDIVAYDTHTEAVQTVLDKFKRIDILVNNAGKAQRSMANETELGVSKQLMDINYLGTLSLTKAVLPHMIKKKRGQIVVNNSVAGIVAFPSASSYSASKHALRGWFDTLRLEQGRNNIDVTQVCPGPIVSEIEKNSLSETVGRLNYRGKMAIGLMSAERCAALMVGAIINKLDEVWISRYPVLIAPYLAQYMPAIYTWGMNFKGYGMKSFQRISDAKDLTKRRKR